MKIEELQSMIKVISRNKIKQIEIIGQGDNQDRHSSKLYELLLNKKIQTEEDINDYFFLDNKHQKKYVNRLKRKLKANLINTLFFVDINQPNFTDIQKAYYTCYKNSTAVKILIGRSARKPAISLAEKTIRKSIKFDFTDITIELARTLRIHYSSIEGNKKKFTKYKNILKKYSKIYQAELEAEEYYSEIIINFTGSQSTKPELLDIVESYYHNLRKVLKVYNSYKLNLNSYMIFVLRFEIQNDYKNTLKVCDEAINYFQSRPHIASKVVIINFYLKKLGCYIMLKKFSEGKAIAEKCLTLQPIGSINWLFTLHYYVILSFHSNQFERAYKLYRQAVEHLSIDNKVVAFSEHWKIHEAMLNYLIAIGKLQSNLKMNKREFKLAKFINDLPTYSKDKQGINIQILIIQILFLLQQGKFDQIIDRTESLKTYTHRYLRRDDTFRSNCFIKMLLCLPAANFHRAGVIRKAKKYLELLKSVPIEEANQSPEVEIIPYEVLWTFVLESLDNKFH